MVIIPAIPTEFVSLGGSSRRARNRKVETGDSEGEDQADDRLAVEYTGATTVSEATCVELTLRSPDVFAGATVELHPQSCEPWWEYWCEKVTV